MAFKLNKGLILVTGVLALAALVKSQLQGEVLKFRLSATGLPNKDFADGSKNDPYVKMFVKDVNSRAFRHFGDTPVIHDNNDPVWPDIISFPYINGTYQRLKFMVKDHDVGWIADNHLGRVEIQVDDLLKEMTKNGAKSDKPIRLFLTQPQGGILIYTPVLELRTLTF